MAHAVCARAGADASPSDTHMARGPARKRGVRLSEAEASAVVDYVCTDSGSKVPLSAFGQLLRDACRDSPHEVLDTDAQRLAVAGWLNRPVEGSDTRRKLIAGLAGALLVGNGVKFGLAALQGGDGK